MSPHRAVRVEAVVPAFELEPGARSSEYSYAVEAERVGAVPRGSDCLRDAVDGELTLARRHGSPERLGARLAPYYGRFCAGRWRGRVIRQRSRCVDDRCHEHETVSVTLARFGFRVSNRLPYRPLLPRRGHGSTTFVLRYYSLGPDGSGGDEVLLYGPPRTRCAGLLARQATGSAPGFDTVAIVPSGETRGVKPHDVVSPDRRGFRRWCPGLYRVHLVEQTFSQPDVLLKRYAFRVVRHRR